jgi:uncharacterized protein YqkB
MILEVRFMFLEFSPAATAKLTDKISTDTRLVLDFDDGVGPFSNSASCTMDKAFNLVFCDVDQLTADYDRVIDSSLGPVYIKDYAANQLDPNMKLDVDKYLRYSLSGESGVLDSNISFRNIQAA